MTYSLLPLDVGFCPRRLGLVVLLPADASRVRYRSGRAVRVAAGTAATVAARLGQAGYSVRIVPPGALSFSAG